MTLANTAHAYGSVAKAFHWTVAVFILALIPLGIVANGLPADTSEQIARKATLFSIHKTLGVTLFFLALARIGWAVVQPRPAALHPDRRLETAAATTAHWLLYASLLLVPLSGWAHHAATEGFAPIWWPFGQSFPFVPKDPALAETLGGLHIVFERVLALTLLLHVAAALKHHLWDGDDTLRRMLPGSGPREAAPAAARPLPAWTGPAAALSVFAVAIAIGGALGIYGKPRTATTAVALQEAPSDWRVTEGEIGLTIRQLGSDVTGRFGDWTAAIDFAETPSDGRHGSAEVTIAIPSLTLGAVTDQAMEQAYFHAEEYPTARFEADLLPGDGANTFRAQGTLTLRGESVPVAFPFTLAIEGDRAEASFDLTLDRRDFGIGANQDDPGTLGFEVGVRGQLTATRAEDAPAES
ncbi:MAG: cytochrome b/b6 domain-containing protein [Paracoccaceae bacterium]|jgi:cytochrome b561/polyisoprenoid-binding protein YceI|nr:cytochrome b/b6 domain-containing protein [Paracoccaceae bacterium]